MHLGKGVPSLKHVVFFFLNVFFNDYLLKAIFREILQIILLYAYGCFVFTYIFVYHKCV